MLKSKIVYSEKPILLWLENCCLLLKCLFLKKKEVLRTQAIFGRSQPFKKTFCFLSPVLPFQKVCLMPFFLRKCFWAEKNEMKKKKKFGFESRKKDEEWWLMQLKRKQKQKLKKIFTVARTFLLFFLRTLKFVVFASVLLVA